jgi:hypothetical protein
MNQKNYNGNKREAPDTFHSTRHPDDNLTRGIVQETLSYLFSMLMH